MDRAEEAVFAIAERRSAPSFYLVKDFLEGHLEMLMEVHKDPHRRPVTALSTGFEEFDALTSGLRRSDLIVLAGRPGTGKTSLAMGIVRHAAVAEKKKVGLFSLEMTKEQVLERLICAEAQVDLQRLRDGYLPAAKWGLIAEAAGRLHDAVILVDDASTASVLGIKAKARQMMKRHDGLDLIVVDYLQLVEAGIKSDVREQQIAYISRALKSLARELEVPVIACSQLNRAVERRESKRPQLSDLRECVTGDTRVVLSEGRWVPVRDLVGQAPVVVAVSPQGKLVKAQCKQIWCVGKRLVMEVHLASGRRMRATANHRLLGPRGWVEVGDLTPGDRVAIARRLPQLAEPTVWPEARLALLAHLIGDGSYLPHQPLRYTTSSEECSARVASAARDEFGARVTRYPGRGRWHQLVIAGNGTRWRPTGVNRWLRDLGVFGERSFEKRIPPEIFRLGDFQLGLFLQHLWATDGTISPRRPGQRGSHAVAFTTCSRGLADDVAALLLRLGMVGRIRYKEEASGRPTYTVSVQGAGPQRRFLDGVGAFGPRRPQAERLATALVGVVPNTNVDTLPHEFFDRVQWLMRQNGISQRAMAARRGTSYGGSAHFRFSPSRTLLAEYAEDLDDQLLREQAASDIFWDRVSAVEPAGEEDVYDLTVPGPACWLAEGIVSHNSGAIEQDADLVVFIYRPDYYDDPDQTGPVAETEVIIAKQRNGPLGKFRLMFHKSSATFYSPAKQGEVVPF
jgi:replicative DNA helicase